MQQSRRDFIELPSKGLRTWFLDAKGISREVIQADICRYLGADAVCRRPSERNGVLMYEISAYRPLTTAMIRDLMDDSKRWEAELRKSGRTDRDFLNPRAAISNFRADHSKPDSIEVDEARSSRRSDRELRDSRAAISSSIEVDEARRSISDDRDIRDMRAALCNPHSDLSKPISSAFDGENEHALTLPPPAGTRARNPTMPGPFRRKGRLLELPILLNNESFIALPDSGASCNMITYAAVDHLRIVPDIAPNIRSFTVGSGRFVRSIGKVKIACSFMDLPEKPTIEEFFVLDKLVDGVSTILSRPYLVARKIYGRYQFRLRQRSLKLGLRVALLTTLPIAASTTQTFFLIKINDNVERAVPDTGSDINVVSEEWARRRGLEFRNLEYGDCNSVQFANGDHLPLYQKVIVHFDTLNHRPLTFADVENLHQPSEMAPNPFSGEREDVSDTMPTELGGGWNPKLSDQYRTFYVFHGLPCDILVGQLLLDAIDAYQIHPDSFIQVGPDGRELSSQRESFTGETSEEYRLQVIRSAGWLLSKFKGQEMPVGPEQRVAFINWVHDRACTRNDVQLNNELSRLVALNTWIHDHHSEMLNAPDQPTSTYHNNQKQYYEDQFNALAETVRTRIS